MKRWLLLALSFAAIAYPQTRECEASAAATPLRREGQAELLSSLLLQCEGGPAVAPGAPLPLATITLTFNVPVASRSLPSRVTEALLLVNEPPASAQYPCLEESCPAVNGAPLGSGAGQARNVYAAVAVGSNVLRWSNVPLPAGDLRLRFANLRVSAPTGPVFAEVAVSSATRTEVEDSPIQLGYAAGEIQFSMRDIFDRALTSPVTMSKLSGANFPITSTVSATFLVKFTETFGSAMKKRALASSANNPTQAGAQSAPQPANLTESGTHNPALGPLDGAGLADHGTRLVARFTNIPAGVTIYVSTIPVLPGTTANIGARLLAVDVNGGGPYQLQATTTVAAGGLPVAALPVSGGTATAVWEVLEPSAQTDSLAFGVLVSYPATVQPEGVIQVTGGAGPAGIGTGSGPIPRFRSLPAPANAVGFISSVPRITEVTLQQGTVGEAYPAVTLTATGGNPPYRWSLESGALPAGITLSADGRISGVPQVPGSFPFAARVTDSSFAIASIGLGLVIRPAQIFLPSQALPAGVVGTPYPATTLTAQGGGAPFTYRVSGGSLPPGVQLSTGGQLTGTPRDDGNFEFRVTVTDRTGLAYTQSYEITVAAILAIVTQTPLRSGQLGSNYGIAFRATGGVAPYTWSLSSGQVPPGLALAVDGTLAGTPTRAGTFGFTVAVRDRGGRAVARSFTILVLAAREDDEDENELRPQPDELKFFATAGAPAQTQPVRFPVLAADATALRSRVETKRGGNWLSVLNAPLTPFGVAQTRTYLVTANPGSLGEGTYTGTVIFTTAQRKEIEVPVTMTIRKAQPLLSVVPTGLTFTALEGGGAPPVQRIFVTNQGSGTAGFSVRSSTMASPFSSTPNWLSASVAAGIADASTSVAVPAIEVRANPGGLRAGEYYAALEVRPNDNSAPPLQVTVVFNVLDPNRVIGPLVEPNGAALTTSQPATVTITNVGRSAISFFTRRTGTTNGADWLTVTPASGTVNASSSVALTVRAAGTTGKSVERGNLVVQFEGGAQEIIDVALINPASIAPRAGTLADEPPGDPATCAPSQLVPVFTVLGPGFNVFAGWPTPVEVQVYDDCGAPLNTGSVVVSFSNNDPAITMTVLRDGRWSGIWVARNTLLAQVTVTATAEVPGSTLRGSHQVTGNIAANALPPLVNSGGVVSAASFVPRAPVAPGSLISIFGTRLASSTRAAETLPLRPQLGDTTVTLAGRELPLLYTSDGQVNAMVPYGLPTDVPTQMLVRRGNALSVPEPVIVAAAQPAVFTMSQSGKGQGAITDTGFRLADAKSPVARGDALIIFATGLGDVSPAVESGSAAPSVPLARVMVPVTATVGGKEAQVLFAGLAPGFAGLYQVAVIVPPDAPVGADVPVVVTMGGQSSPPVSAAIR